ncbi:MAG: hypothetical protein ACHQFX_00305 [Chitinophagales bacterium]
MLISPFKRKILKISAYFLGSIVVLSVAFHFWFINHAEGLIEDLVELRSNGKLKLQVKKFKFNWFSYNMQLRKAVFYSTDTATSATAYRFAVEEVNVRVKEIFPLIFEKKILIDSLSLVNPDVAVTRLRSVKNEDTTRRRRDVSLTHEMGKVYNSIQDALQVLQVNRFQINNGKFTLINKIKAGQLPVSIGNIYFHLDNLQVDTSDSDGKQKILFSDNVSLRSFNQDISFPDGRHRLSFSNFHINILKKIIEFDSCTVSATKGDSSKSSFSVFFDKLQMTNIDFDTLYQNEVIKADSVYCINPRFRLDVELGKKGDNKKSTPRLDELIQLLTGDMELAFVVVTNGSFDINTIRDGRPGSFTSDHNNFEMQGLRIDKGASRPVSVNSFAMAIRNYENFLRDSTFAMEFDSILFINNSVLLSNFSFKQVRDEKIVNSFTMPQFELRGLSWDDLVFDRKLTAEKATLYRPVINYTSANKSQNIFHTLSDIGRIIELQNLDMKNGQINIHFGGGGELKLENADVSLLSQDLLQSVRIASIQRSVRQLKFRKGFFKSKGITIEIENGDVLGETGKLSAGLVRIKTREKNLLVNARNVAIDRMNFNNASHITAIDGIRWDEATVDLKALVKGKGSGNFTITNINGANTKLALSVNNQHLTAFLQSFSADKLLLPRKGKPQVINLHANGKDLLFNAKNISLAVNRFLVADHGNSTMENLSFKNHTATDSVYVSIPTLSFEPDLNSIINGTIAAENVKLRQPVISIRQYHSFDTTSNPEKRLPEVAIGKLSVEDPEFTFIQTGDKETRIEWFGKREKNNLFELNNLKVKNDPVPFVSLDKLEFALNSFSITAANKTFSTGKGKINATFTGIQLDRKPTDGWNWKGFLAELLVKDLVSENLGKHNGRLEIRSARINAMALQSATIFNLRQSLKENKGFRLKEITGSWDSDNNHFDWHSLEYDKNSKVFSVDSFTFRPTPDKESFIASHKYQTDYITLQTGRIDAGPFDIDKYLTDTVISAGTVNVSSVSMKTYRDKRKPAREGIIKPLPVNLLKKIPLHLSLDTMNLSNAYIEYSELNEKTNQTGVVIMNRMSAKIFPINNYDLKPDDSLSFEAQAWLMDSVRITLKVKESYTDSLAGFLLSATATRADARILNPVLIPLVSAKIESGFLDTLSMQVTGKEYVAIGEMKMYYHDLKVKVLKNGTEKKSFGNSFVNFLVNSLIIKKSNNSRTGTVFFERLRNKSTMNYLVKMTISGISSSAGIKKSKKMLRRYKKA